MPLMEFSGADDCRIVLVSSDGHNLAHPFNASSIQGKHLTEDNFECFRNYANSKLYQVRCTIRHKGEQRVSISLWI